MVVLCYRSVWRWGGFVGKAGEGESGLVRLWYLRGDLGSGVGGEML